MADDDKRTATLVDTAGIASQVTGLGFSGSFQKFYSSWGQLAIMAKPFDIAVPLDALVSVEARGNGHIVTYLWQGKEVSLTGTLYSAEFTGKSDFGDIKLGVSKLKSLKFDQAPKSPTEKPKTINRATLTLEDGTSVRVDDLRRHASYYSSEGYILGGSTRYLHYTDFRFLRGESLATVPFDTIKRIDLLGEKEVSVLLKNGNKATGTRSPNRDASIDGWTAVSATGNIFLGPGQVKAIEFAESTQQP